MATFSARWDGDILCLSGELDIAHEEELISVSAEAPVGQEELVVDMSELAFIDSSGIRAILTIAKRNDAKEVVLRSPAPNVRRVLDLVEIDHLPNIRIE